MLDKQFEELKQTGNLPSPAGVGMAILRLAQDEEASLDELVHTIQVDPALTGRILKLASSALMSRSGGVVSVREAAMRLGLRTVYSVALGFTLIGAHRSGACQEFDYDEYWSDSLAMAVAAQACSKALQVGDPAEVFTLGLLARIGELALASVHPTDYGRLLVRWRNDPQHDLRRLETEAFSIDNLEVSVAMLADWGLPELFGQALTVFGRGEAADEEDAGGLVSVLGMARALADYCMTEAGDRFQSLERFQELGRAAGLGEFELDHLGAQAGKEWREWGEVLRISTTDVPSMAAVRSALPRSRDGVAGEEEEARIRILAVDDDPVALRLLARHLETAGHDVVTASNGREALAAALEYEPHIVVTDWMMPEMDGLQLCKALRLYPSGRRKYILLLTGRAEEERVLEAFDAGADDYIVKPFRPKLLLARVLAGRRVVLLQEQVEREKKTQREQMAKLGVMTRKLREAAMTDPLTELANRRYAMRRLETDWTNSERSKRPLSVVMLDLDHFKAINDTYGHDVGDAVLQRTARVLATNVRRGDVVARIGGEEFLVVCPETDAAAALQVAERMRAAIEAASFESGEFAGVVTVSAGVADRSAGVTSKDDLLKLADEATYRSKGSGRNRVTVADPRWGKKSA